MMNAETVSEAGYEKVGDDYFWFWEGCWWRYVCNLIFVSEALLSCSVKDAQYTIPVLGLFVSLFLCLSSGSPKLLLQ
jgi:hypothetical protein